ncbi:MAG: hypothetical protein GY855_06375, partial [candidate division Zixibacteria bacterium]|nr:hypothetical protein [candidate division Zixibacteria bacterium]
FNGLDSIKYIANDGIADSNEATISITVTEVNDKPVANNLDVITDEDIEVALILTGSDIDEDAFEFTVTTNPTFGILSGTVPDLTFSPNANYNGADTFQFITNDGQENSNPATVNITINAVNDPPVVVSKDLITEEEALTSFSLENADIDGDTVQFIITKNPTNGTLTGGQFESIGDVYNFNTSGYAKGVYISDTTAYVADGSSGLQIIDVSDPESPSFLGSYDTSGYAEGVYISGTTAYVADASSGLQIIDVSDPESPSFLGNYNTSGYAEGVYISGTTAYVADGSSGLQIIDVSNPESPSFLG